MVRRPDVYRVRFITGAALITLASGAAQAAMISHGGTGYSPADYAPDAVAELRNLKNNGDFEIGLRKSGVSGYFASAQASWIKGINSVVITYDTAVNALTVSLNGAASSMTLTDDPGAIWLHILGTNAGANSATLSVGSLSLNGSPVDVGGYAAYLMASDKSGSTALGTETHVRIDDAALAQASWNLTATITADWTGPAPNASHARIDVSFAQVPAPGASALAATGLLAVSMHRRRVRRAG